MSDQDYEPVKVHVVRADPALSAAREQYRTIYETYLLTANEPVQNVLAQDPDRVYYTVIAVDNDIVLGPTKGICASPVNLAQATTSGPNQTEVIGSNPAAAAPFVYVNNSGAPQVIYSAIAVLTCDATVASRFPQILVKDAAGASIFAAADATAVTASGVVTVSGSQGISQANNSGGVVSLPLPANLAIPAGGTLVFTGQDAGSVSDQWSGVRLVLSQPVTVTPPTQAPNGAYLPKGIPRDIQDNGQVYAGATTTATDSRVTIIAVCCRE